MVKPRPKCVDLADIKPLRGHFDRLSQRMDGLDMLARRNNASALAIRRRLLVATSASDAALAETTPLRWHFNTVKSPCLIQN